MTFADFSVFLILGTNIQCDLYGVEDISALLGGCSPHPRAGPRISHLPFFSPSLKSVTAEDGFVLKQGEGREGKDPLQGFLESWKNPRGWGDAEGTVGTAGEPPASKLLLQLFARQE